MNKGDTFELIKKINTLLSQRLPEGTEIILQPNSIDGVNLKVVSEDFEDKDNEIREEEINQVLSPQNITLDDPVFRFVELLTPEENELYGTPLNALEPLELPLWSESLMTRQEPCIIKRLDEEDIKPFYVSFYSFKGGVGRTTTLAYTAHFLANKGYRVVAVDFDLEAPGLNGYLEPFKEIKDQPGLVDFLFSHQNGLNDSLKITECIRPISIKGKGDFFYIPAGNISPQYVHLLSQIDFQRYYRLQDNPLHRLVEEIEKELRPDVVLIDSRTGLADWNAPFLFEMSDMIIFFFFPHPQTKPGFDLTMQGILNRKNFRGYTPEFRFIVAPVPGSDTQQKYLNRASDWIDDIIGKIQTQYKKESEPLDIITEDTVSQMYYNDRIANADSLLLDEPDIQQGCQAVIEWMLGYLSPKDKFIEEIPESDKESILNSLYFETPIAEEQEDVAQFFVKTADFYKIFRPEVMLITGRKGTGKTQLFRLLLENLDEAKDFVKKAKRYNLPQNLTTVAVHKPKHSGKDIELDRDIFKEIEKQLINKERLDWNAIWGFYIALKLVERDPSLQISEPLREKVETIQKSQYARRTVLAQFENFSQQKAPGILIKDVLREINRDLETKGQTYWLLFDGLDVGFGGSGEDLTRRKKVVTALFEFAYEMAPQLSNLGWKIFLRSDIWRGITFQNQSHFYERNVDLKWDKEDYFRVLIKQNSNNEFGRFIRQKLGLSKDVEVEAWDGETIRKAIWLLIGERTKGARTAFSDNWVWNRLRDGNEEHNPRNLIMMFSEACGLEKEYFKNFPYPKAIIRHKALVHALPRVSEEAVKAILDEYAELAGIIKILRSSFSPVELSDLKSRYQEDNFDDIFKVAREAGLITPYYDEKRYAVPDLYLKGLDMTRKGQA